MKKVTVWETYHGKDLDKLVDKAHTDLYESDPEMQEQDVKIQFLNNEYVVTVRAFRPAKYHYETAYAQLVGSGNDKEWRPSIIQLEDDLKRWKEKYEDGFEIVKISETDGMKINSVNSEGEDYESAYVVIKVYDE